MPVDYPSRLDLFAIGRTHVLTRAESIDPAQVDIQGSDVNIIVGSASFIGYECVLQLAQKMAALLLDGAVGEDLDRYAYDRYNETRKGASAAVGSARFFRTAMTAGAGSVPIGTLVITLTGLEYITTTTATFSATDSEATCDVRAVQAGKATQVGANTIRRIDEPDVLFDPSLQIINDVATAGGEDAETDEIFRERVRDFFLTARRGTLGAIEFGATIVEGVVSADAQESLAPNNQPARVVELFIADGSGVANAALGAVVRNSLEDYRAGGIAVILNTSVPQIVAVALQLSFVAGVDTASLSEDIRNAIVTFINSLEVNESLLRNDLGSVLRRFKADGLIPVETSVVVPTGDLVPSTGQTLRTTIDNVTIS